MLEQLAPDEELQRALVVGGLHAGVRVLNGVTEHRYTAVYRRDRFGALVLCALADRHLRRSLASPFGIPSTAAASSQRASNAHPAGPSQDVSSPCTGKNMEYPLLSIVLRGFNGRLVGELHFLGERKPAVPETSKMIECATQLLPLYLVPSASPA